ncbi:hypothetical protein EOD39_6400 [Acipenser ruthenus]|uniref:Uncharacterized protein n=1 Tax=Acipenser ruthenus TaxID=7906 RepID=A0A662YYG7_ACIRT|nr:hypothetical protein EOD39_6400 [Acipenser ruthenus]
MAEDAIRLRDWIQDSAGLEAQSMPIAIRVLWLMDRERWEAYEREHTPDTLEEGVELLPPPPHKGDCLQLPPPPREKGPGRDAGISQQPLHRLLRGVQGKTARLLPRRGPVPPQPLPEWPTPAPRLVLTSPGREVELPLTHSGSGAPLVASSLGDACTSPPRDACTLPPRDASKTSPRDAGTSPPGDACTSLPGEACPGGSLLLNSRDLLRLEEPALALPAHLLTASLLAAFPLPVVQRCCSVCPRCQLFRGKWGYGRRTALR